MHMKYFYYKHRIWIYPFACSWRLSKETDSFFIYLNFITRFVNVIKAYDKGINYFNIMSSVCTTYLKCSEASSLAFTHIATTRLIYFFCDRTCFNWLHVISIHSTPYVWKKKQQIQYILFMMYIDTIYN